MDLQPQRIIWVDHLKALGILLVVLAHHDDEVPKSIVQFIYSFHVPIFFFASGLLYFPQKYVGLKPFAKQKAKTLLLPYFSLSLATYMLWLVLAPFRTGEPPLGAIEILKGLAGILISSHGLIWMSHNGPLWFLTCLWVVEVCFHMIYMLVVKLRPENMSLVIGVILILVSVLGYFDRVFASFRLPWTMDTALTGCVFFGVGFLARKRLSDFLMEVSFLKVLLFILLGVFSFAFSYLNDFVNLAFNRLGNYFYFYAASFSGIGICMLICKMIPPNRIFNYLGRNSLIILAFHLPAFSILRGLEKFLLPPNLWHFFGGSLQGATMCSMVQILAVVPAGLAIKRYARFMVGWR